MEIVEARRRHHKAEIDNDETRRSAKVVDLMQRLQAQQVRGRCAQGAPQSATWNEDKAEEATGQEDNASPSTRGLVAVGRDGPFQRGILPMHSDSDTQRVVEQRLARLMKIVLIVGLVFIVLLAVSLILRSAWWKDSIEPYGAARSRSPQLFAGRINGPSIGIAASTGASR